MVGKLDSGMMNRIKNFAVTGLVAAAVLAFNPFGRLGVGRRVAQIVTIAVGVVIAARSTGLVRMAGAGVGIAGIISLTNDLVLPRIAAGVTA